MCVPGFDPQLAERRIESVEDPSQNLAQPLFREDVGLEAAFENQTRDDRPQCRCSLREIIICSRAPSGFTEHLYIELSVPSGLGHFEDSAEPLFRFGMTERI